MKKNIYVKPQLSVIDMEPLSIIANSRNPGAEIPDVGWGSSKRQSGGIWNSPEKHGIWNND